MNSSSEIVCQVCGDSIVESELIYCKNCSTPHHKDCWAYTRICSTYGCGSTMAVTSKSDCSLTVPASIPVASDPASGPDKFHIMDPRALLPAARGKMPPAPPSRQDKHSNKLKSAGIMMTLVLLLRVVAESARFSSSVAVILFGFIVLFIGYWIYFERTGSNSTPDRIEARSAPDLTDPNSKPYQMALKNPENGNGKSAARLDDDDVLPVTRADLDDK